VETLFRPSIQRDHLRTFTMLALDAMYVRMAGVLKYGARMALRAALRSGRPHIVSMVGFDTR